MKRVTEVMLFVMIIAVMATAQVPEDINTKYTQAMLKIGTQSVEIDNLKADNRAKDAYINSLAQALRKVETVADLDSVMAQYKLGERNAVKKIKDKKD